MSKIEAPRYPNAPVDIAAHGVVSILRSGGYGKELRHMLSHSQDYERAAVLSWSFQDKKWVIHRPRLASDDSIDSTSMYENMERAGGIPVIFAHTHPLEYGNSWSFVPSNADLTRSQGIFLRDTDNREIYPNAVGALVLADRRISAWAWQVPKTEQRAKLISHAYGSWVRSVVGEVRISDISKLEQDLISAGLSFVRGNLDPKQLGGSFAALIERGNFRYGIREIQSGEE